LVERPSGRRLAVWLRVVAAGPDALLEAGDENTLAIWLDNPPSSSRWYPGGGVYRDVWLVKTRLVHVGQWGTQLSTPEVLRKRAIVNLRVRIPSLAPYFRNSFHPPF